MTVQVRGLQQAMAALERVKVSSRVATKLAVTAGGGVLAAHLKDRAPKSSGKLANSIGVREVRVEHESATADIGAAVDYDRFYQQGTSRQPPRPYSPEVAAEAESAVAAVAAGIFRAAMSRGGR